ncbi:stimulus-sensing domain-containing protein, partial [Devosia chinhatensis]
DSDIISINPDRLLNAPRSNVSPLSSFYPSLYFPIIPARVSPLLRNLITPTRPRARIYSHGCLLILAIVHIFARSEVLRRTIHTSQPSFFLSAWLNSILSWAPGHNYATYQEYQPAAGACSPDVASALHGAAHVPVRVDSPVQHVFAVCLPAQPCA